MSRSSPTAGEEDRAVLVEICVDDVDGALTAEAAGADRIELCANLLEGGTTPSIGTVEVVLSRVRRLGVQVIVRPRGGGFVYSGTEIDVVCRDIAALREAASAAAVPVGVVVGALTADGSVDLPALRRFVDAAEALPVTFHKAFDAANDLVAAYETLSEAGVERILTSGGPHPATEGIDLLGRLVQLSRSGGSRPRILVGGSVRASNVRRILAATGADEVHLRAQSPSHRGDGTLRTDGAVVRAVVAAVRERPS